jgi:diguanylate cyclase (GGDEF)-like protein/PAS domain S-box-containing protein
MPERLAVLRQAVDQAYNPVVITGPELEPPGPRFLYVNQAFCDMTGYDAGEVLGQTPRILQGPRTERAVLDELRRRLTAGERFHGSTVNYRKDGTPYLVEWNITPVRDEAGETECFVSVQRDVTRRAEAERFNQTLLDSLGEGVFGIDAAGHFTFVNPAGLRLLGYDSEAELLGDNAHALTHHHDADGEPYPEARCPIYRVMETGEPLEEWRDWFWRRDGSGFHVEVYATPLWREMGTVFGGVVVFRDVSEQVRLEGQLRHLAHHDPLTGLYNRTALEEQLDQELHRATRYGTTFSLVMFDLDHFKAVNDRYGHDIGDHALQTVARLVSGQLRTSDALGRWGGEEFLILLPETGSAEANTLAERIRRTVAEHDFGEPDNLSLSLGIATLRDQEPRSELFRRLDAALYRAKDEGRNRVAAAGPDSSG